jgi:TPP-dependent trihydroxycyclohexane-1,2-dione (THcHDO) dehydratase
VNYAELNAAWEETMQLAYLPPTPNSGAGGLLSQNEVIGVVNELSDSRDVVVCAAGSMPGDLHKLWRTRDPKGYHVETDPLISAPGSESWWDVPVSATSTLESTKQARKTYEERKATQRLFL